MNKLFEIEAWLQSEIEPRAQIMDSAPSTLFQAFKQLGDRNWLALRLPSAQGGLGWDEHIYSQFQVLIASYSGALAFLTTQHHSAIRMIGSSSNQRLKATLLPSLISGDMGTGVGFSQLRRRGTPMMSARPMNGGYALSGTVPWVTGLGCFDGFICGASLPDGQILMGWVPLTQAPAPSTLMLSEPMSLAAMASTQTVEVRLQDWWMDSHQVIAIHESDWLQQKDQENTLHHGFYALGAARGALKLLANAQAQFSMDTESQQAIALFHEDYQWYETQMLNLLPHRQDCPDRCIQAKADAIHFAGRCAQAAIAISGGGANHMTHPAQRIYREVLAFTVFGQTPAAKTATLSALSSSCRPLRQSDHQSRVPASED